MIWTPHVVLSTLNPQCALFMAKIKIWRKKWTKKSLLVLTIDSLTQFTVLNHFSFANDPCNINHHPLKWTQNKNHKIIFRVINLNVWIIQNIYPIAECRMPMSTNVSIPLIDEMEMPPNPKTGIGINKTKWK